MPLEWAILDCGGPLVPDDWSEVPPPDDGGGGGGGGNEPAESDEVGPLGDELREDPELRGLALDVNELDDGKGDGKLGMELRDDMSRSLE